MYYVDAQYGNDGTGQPENRQLPYQTISAALTAAYDADLPSTIHVWPDIYTDTGLASSADFIRISNQSDKVFVIKGDMFLIKL